MNWVKKLKDCHLWEKIYRMLSKQLISFSYWWKKLIWMKKLVLRLLFVYCQDIEMFRTVTIRVAIALVGQWLTKQQVLARSKVAYTKTLGNWIFAPCLFLGRSYWRTIGDNHRALALSGQNKNANWHNNRRPDEKRNICKSRAIHRAYVSTRHFSAIRTKAGQIDSHMFRLNKGRLVYG